MPEKSSEEAADVESCGIHWAKLEAVSQEKIMNFNESLGTGAGKPMIEQNISNATIDENADGSAKRSTKQYIWGTERGLIKFRLHFGEGN